MASYRKRGKNWYYSYVDEHGRKVEAKGCPNRKATEEIAAKAEVDVARIKAGLVDPRTDRLAKESRRALVEHLADFAAHLAAKGGARGAKHASNKSRRAYRLLAELSGLQRLGDITHSAVQLGIAKLELQGLSIQTRNHYLDAAKMFCLWALSDGRIDKTPLASLSRKNPSSDRRRTRRSLTLLECRALISTTENGPEVLDIPARDRVAIYMIALGTGFRAEEMLQLQVHWFHLDDVAPKIVVPAKYTKNKQEAEQFIPPWLATAIRPWLATREPGKPIFRFRSAWLAPILRSDLKAAGIEVQTAEGVVDFHALRTTYTNLFMLAGPTIKQLQRGARHSDIKTTTTHYLKATDEGMGDVMTRFPDLALTDEREGK